MKTYINLATILCLVLASGMGLLSGPVYADGDDRAAQKPIRLQAFAWTGPIGEVESMGRVKINGREACAGISIWGSELIEAPAGNDVSVSLRAMGRVTLKNRTIARLTAAPALFDDGTSGGLLIATLIDGDMIVSLQEDAEAYVEACGSVFTASRGAGFSVQAHEGRAAFHTLTGHVRSEVQEPKHFIRPVGRRASITVKARSSVQLQFQVTDVADKPVPDLPVTVTVAGNGVLGSGATTGTSVTVTTTAQGIAQVPFTAGSSPGSTSTVTASAPGAGAASAITVSTLAAGGLSASTIGIIVGLGAGGGLIAATQAGGGSSQSPPPPPPPPPPMPPRITFNPPTVRP
ncbi:MAG: hypothetical protein L0229_24925 [Blastocatellia bacterium]|nr:hypothetical protein [Blastocatellia bacterium]